APSWREEPVKVARAHSRCDVDGEGNILSGIQLEGHAFPQRGSVEPDSLAARRTSRRCRLSPVALRHRFSAVLLLAATNRRYRHMPHEPARCAGAALRDRHDETIWVRAVRPQAFGECSDYC